MTVWIFLSSFPVIASVSVKAPAPDFTLRTAQGAQANSVVSLSDFTGHLIILEWTSDVCPFVRKHYKNGHMQRLQRALTEKGVVWLSILSSAPGTSGYADSVEAAKMATARGSYANYTLLDPTGDVGRRFGAKATPYMVVIDRQQRVRYMGAIDNHPSAALKGLDKAVNYVWEAFNDLENGKEVRFSVTSQYGCAIKYGSE